MKPSDLIIKLAGVIEYAGKDSVRVVVIERNQDGDVISKKYADNIFLSTIEDRVDLCVELKSIKDMV